MKSFIDRIEELDSAAAAEIRVLFERIDTSVENLKKHISTISAETGLLNDKLNKS